MVDSVTRKRQVATTLQIGGGALLLTSCAAIVLFSALNLHRSIRLDFGFKHSAKVLVLGSIAGSAMVIAGFLLKPRKTPPHAGKAAKSLSQTFDSSSGSEASTSASYRRRSLRKRLPSDLTNQRVKYEMLSQNSVNDSHMIMVKGLQIGSHYIGDYQWSGVGEPSDPVGKALFAHLKKEKAAKKARKAGLKARRPSFV